MSKELAKIDDDQYLVLSKDVEKLRSVTEANLGSAGDASIFDLEQIQLPTAGGSKWTLPDGSAVESFRGVVCAWQNTRAYWPGDFSGGEPPQCSSPDGVEGIGDPGGKCADCPYAQFGSADNGSGQACKAMRRVFVLRADRVLPALLTLPPTSITPCRKYLTRLTSQMLPYWQVVTEFGLQVEKNEAGIKYVVVTFGEAGALTDEQAEQVKAYAGGLEDLLTAPVKTEEYLQQDEGVEL